MFEFSSSSTFLQEYSWWGQQPRPVQTLTAEYDPRPPRAPHASWGARPGPPLLQTLQPLLTPCHLL